MAPGLARGNAFPRGATGHWTLWSTHSQSREAGEMPLLPGAGSQDFSRTLPSQLSVSILASLVQ